MAGGELSPTLNENGISSVKHSSQDGFGLWSLLEPGDLRGVVNKPPYLLATRMRMYQV